MDNVDFDLKKLLEVVEAKGNKKTKGNQLKAFHMNRPVVGLVIHDSDDERIELPESDQEDGPKIHFKFFKDEDMGNPLFSVGLVFPMVEKLRQEIIECGKNRVEIKLLRNDMKRIRDHCVEGHCPWNLYASYDSRANSL